MTPEMDRKPRVALVHSIPGRTRLRIGGARLTTEQAARIADTIAAQPGCARVEVDGQTGSVLCLHPESVTSDVLLEVARSAVDGLGPQVAPELTNVASVPITRLARELARVFRDANRDLLSATDGRLDIGTAATLTFLGAGALQVLSRQEIHAPPWFNLAWWGFRTFMTLESAAIQYDAQTKGGQR